MIRPVAAGDMGPLMALMAELHEATHYGLVKRDNRQMLQVVAGLSASPNGFVRVAEREGQLVGALLGVTEEYWWTDPKAGAKYASDLLFYAKHPGAGAQMMRQFIQWAWGRPRVVKIETAISSGLIGGVAADRFYQRLGFEKRGSLYVMDHPKLRGES